MLQRIITPVVALVLSSFSFGVLFPNLSSAQTQPSSEVFCPIKGSLALTLSAADRTEVVEQQLFETITVQNTANYALGGARIGVGLYKNASDDIPLYWTVIPDKITLRPGESARFSVDLNLKEVPIGTYYYRAFVAQGDEIALLGRSMLSLQTSVKKLEKKGVQQSVFKTTVAINGEKISKETLSFAGQKAISAVIETKNQSSSPVSPSRLVMVTTKGSIPVGTAVGVTDVDTISPLPGKVRTSRFTDNTILGGTHSLYAAYVTDYTFQPVFHVKFETGETEVEPVATYISAVGISEYPLNPSSEIVACFDQTGLDDSAPYAIPPLAIEFVITNLSGSELSTQVVTNEQTGGNNYLRATAGVATQNFNAVTNLQEVRARGTAATLEQAKELGLDGLVTIQTISQRYDCAQFDTCADELEEVISGYVSNKIVHQSFWFYLGIVLAALLLMYLVVRRMEPEDQMSDTSQIKSPDELQ